jgi:uncharacterized beta-barrel protein YwiB (DUF1934 family)
MFKPASIAYVLEWWEVDCGDLGVHRVTEGQMNGILKAEEINARFVRFGDVIVNVAFIRGAKKIVKKITVDEAEHTSLSEKEQRFLAHDNRQKQLEN